MEILEYAFFQKALIAAVLVSIAAGVIGTFITVKKMSLISGSIAHGAFGGLGIAYYLSQNVLFGGLIFSVISAFIITFSRHKNRNNLDSILSIIWAMGMSVGLIFMFLTPGYATDLFSYLFGNILLLSNFDLILIFILDLVIIFVVFLIFNSLLIVLFNEEYAVVKNLPVNFLYLLLFLLIAISVILVIRIVGIVLLIALLTIPSSTAALFSKTVGKNIVLSILLNLVITILGLFISYFINLPSGPIIILLAVCIYFLSLRLVNLKKCLGNKNNVKLFLYRDN